MSVFSRLNGLRIRWVGTLMLVLLSACSDDAPQAPAGSSGEQSAPLFQPQRAALEKAKGVEQTMENQAEALKQQVEQQSQ